MSSSVRVQLLYRWFFFFSSRRRHTRYIGDWSSDVCSSDLRDLAVTATTGNDKITLKSTAGALSLDNAAAQGTVELDALGRSEERRVGKECRARSSQDAEKNDTKDYNEKQ